MSGTLLEHVFVSCPLLDATHSNVVIFAILEKSQQLMLVKFKNPYKSLKIMKLNIRDTRKIIIKWE